MVRKCSDENNKKALASKLDVKTILNFRFDALIADTDVMTRIRFVVSYGFRQVKKSAIGVRLKGQRLNEWVCSRCDDASAITSAHILSSPINDRFFSSSEQEWQIYDLRGKLSTFDMSTHQQILSDKSFLHHI